MAMIYEFGAFALDSNKAELRQNGENIGVEPQVFALLMVLVENRERLVSKDEIIEKVWDGRIVSESALSSRVKSARKALGDDGVAQTFIRTVHGKGFRFVADVKSKSTVILTPSPEQGSSQPDKAHGHNASSKPSIAILPFRLVGIAGPYASIAEALPHELISELSRLRWLFVIARASSFRFRSDTADLGEIHQALGVRYCLSGVVEIVGDKISVAVELADMRDGGVIWGERYAGAVDDIFEFRASIIANIVIALELQIPLNEAQRAQLAAPENLDAWSAYHVGLQHLYRFNQKDNAAATALFERALQLAPDFVRAHAGLSSTHFQNAFLNYTPDRKVDQEKARRHAELSLQLDPLDPFANFAMGRVHWVEDDVVGGIGWLERAVALNPNYAQGHYARGWAEMVAGNNGPVDEGINLALSLSPIDPFRYAMLGVRAFACLERGDDQSAARWGEEAARAPGAHVLIAMIAVAAHQLNGDAKKASDWSANVRMRNPDATQTDFFRAFPVTQKSMRNRLAKALKECGF